MSKIDEAAREMLAELGVADELRSDLSWIDESDDPDDLRACLVRQRWAAWAAQQAHTARGLCAELHVDPDRPCDVRIVLATPDGDRAKESEVGASLLHQAIAMVLLTRYQRGLVDVLRDLAAKVDAGEIDGAEAWRRVSAAMGREDGAAAEIDPATCAHDREVIGGTCSDCAAPVAVAGHLPGCHASGLGPPQAMGDADWTGCGCPAHEEDR